MSKEREPLQEQWDENLLRQIIKRIDVNDCIGNHDVVAEVVKSYLLTKLSNQTTTPEPPKSKEQVLEEVTGKTMNYLWCNYTSMDKILQAMQLYYDQKGE